MQKKGIDAYWLKIIAIAGMTFDHIGIIFGGSMLPCAKTLLFFPGGLTFPIMAYLLVEGYRKTSSVKRYMQRLLLFAAITIPIYMWAFGTYGLNVLMTLLLGLIVLYLHDHMRVKPLFWLAFAGITLLSLLCDWGGIGVPIVLAMHIIKGEKRRVVAPLLTLTIAMGILLGFQAYGVVASGTGRLPLPEMAFFLCSSAVAIPLLLGYSGKRGRGMKYFFYAYYPAHLLVLGVIRGIATGVWLPWS